MISKLFLSSMAYCILSLFCLFHNVYVPRSECCLFHNLHSMVRSVQSHQVFYLKEEHIEIRKWPDRWLPSTNT